MTSDPNRFLDRLRHSTRFETIQHLASCDSTQDLARELPSDGLVWADAQRQGRGRGAGRQWLSGAGLDVEMTLRATGITIQDPTTLAAAVPAAIARALDPFVEPHSIRMKWPNDLYLGNRKLAGILIDALGNPPRTYLIGVGINVNRTEFDPSLRSIATSIALERGRPAPRDQVVCAVGTAVHEALDSLSQGDRGPYAQLFAERLQLLEREVIVELTGKPAREVRGRLRQIDLQFATLEGQPDRIRLARVQQIRPV